MLKNYLKKQYEVHSFSRSKYKSLEILGVTQHQGNLEDFESLRNSLIGINAVIHSASRVGMNGTYEDFYKANVIGTENLIKAMKELGIRKLVYTSSPSVVFGKEELINADESTPYPKKFLSKYAQTKMIAEKIVIEACNKNFWAVSLRPHLIFGNGDQNLIPRLLESRKKNKLKIIGDGKNLVDVIYVENAAYAHVLALNQLSINNEISGESFFIGQGPVVLWDFINLILKKYQLAPVKKRLPLFMAYFLGFLVEIVLTVINRPEIHPPMTRFIALQLGKSHYFNHDKASRLLNFTPLYSIDEAIKKLI